MNRSRAGTAFTLPQSAATLAERYAEVRRSTGRLCAGLSPGDRAPQSMPDASPVKWPLAHTTRFFETFAIERAIPGFQPARGA